MLFGQISLPQSPRQETFWESAGFDSVEKLATLSDAPRWLKEITLMLFYLGGLQVRCVFKKLLGKKQKKIVKQYKVKSKQYMISWVDLLLKRKNKYIWCDMTKILKNYKVMIYQINIHENYYLFMLNYHLYVWVFHLFVL